MPKGIIVKEAPGSTDTPPATKTKTEKHKTAPMPEGSQGLDMSSLINAEPSPVSRAASIVGVPGTTPPDKPADTAEGDPEGTAKTDPDPAATEPKAGDDDNYKQRYEDLEKKLGEQGTELGMMRQFVDQRLTAPPVVAPAPAVPVDELDFIEDPRGAEEKLTNRIMDRVLQQVTPAMTNMVSKQAGHQNLATEHPNYQTDLKSSGFKDFATKYYPPSMIAVMQSADDPATVSHMLTEYKKTIASVPEPDSPAPSADPKIVATNITTKRAAARATGGVPAGPKEASSEKIFNRLELMEMSVNEPIKYAAMQPEIMQAYKDKRVK